jgi:acyl dehydratase
VTHTASFRRLLRPGERVSTRATAVAVEQRRAGAFVQTRLETLDEAGAAVTTTFNSALFLGVGVRGPNRRIDAPPDTPLFAGTGDERWQEPIEVAPDAAHVYSECAAIHNPIHTQRSVALAAGLPGIILHGTATLALAAREIVNRDCGGDPRRLAAISCRFGAMVIPGSSLLIRSTNIASAPEDPAVRFEVLTGQGQPAIRDGWALMRGLRAED